MVIVGLVASAFWLATDILDRLGGPVALVGRGLLIYGGLSLRSLGRWASRVSKSPKLSIETVAERANDVVVGPMFWFAVAGPTGLWASQAVNILARFIVSRSTDRGAEGHPSVRLSRLMDAVPNWLTWLLFSLSAALLGLDGFKALQVG